MSRAFPWARQRLQSDARGLGFSLHQGRILAEWGGSSFAACQSRVVGLSPIDHLLSRRGRKLCGCRHRRGAQCHFFAGIGVWSYALRLAGWSDSEPVWTGSCPCQPFSDAGKGGGFDDERHLWPAWFHLIEERRPGRLFGEQVASKDGLEWLDLVHADLEGADYASTAVDICAAGVGAPHIRQRLYWVADAVTSGWPRLGGSGEDRTPKHREAHLVGNSGSPGSGGHAREIPREESGTQWSVRSLADEYKPSGEINRLADLENERRREGSPDAGWLVEGDRPQRLASGSVPGRHVGGFWRDAEWIYCRDDKYRPVEPGTQPLAHGAPERVGRLRGYGNGLVAHQAAAFIEAYMHC